MTNDGRTVELFGKARCDYGHNAIFVKHFAMAFMFNPWLFLPGQALPNVG